MPVSVSSADIVQAQIPRWLGEALAYQRHVEGSLEPLIQAALARCWLEAHPMPVELAAAEADDGPLMNDYLRARQQAREEGWTVAAAHETQLRQDLIAREERRNPRLAQLLCPQTLDRNESRTSGLREEMADVARRHLWLAAHDMPLELAAAEADDGPTAREWPRLLFFDHWPENWVIAQLRRHGLYQEPPLRPVVLQTEPHADHWASRMFADGIRGSSDEPEARLRQTPGIIFVEEVSPAPESSLTWGDLRQLMLQDLRPARPLHERGDWWFERPLPDQALLNPYLEGDNTARVEAVLRETGGHDLTGMSVPEIEALLARELPLEPEREEA